MRYSSLVLYEKTKQSPHEGEKTPVAGTCRKLPPGSLCNKRQFFKKANLKKNFCSGFFKPCVQFLQQSNAIMILS